MINNCKMPLYRKKVRAIILGDLNQQKKKKKKLIYDLLRREVKKYAKNLFSSTINHLYLPIYFTVCLLFKTEKIYQREKKT